MTDSTTSNSSARVPPEPPSGPATAFGPVALASDVIADRWTILIVRELLDAPARFTDLHDALPGLSRTMLSSRLRRLVSSGLIERVCATAGPSCGYRLTSSGEAVRPVIAAMGAWASTWVSPERQATDVAALLRRMETAINAGPPARAPLGIEFRFQEEAVRHGWLRVSTNGSTRAWTQGIAAAEKIDVIVTTTSEVLTSLGCGGMTCRAALEAGKVHIAGTPRAVATFHELFTPGMFTAPNAMRPTPSSAGS